MKQNIITNVDAYKLSHNRMLDGDIEYLSSYVEARIGEQDIVMFGTRYFFSEYLHDITMEDIEEAALTLDPCSVKWHRDGWEIIVNELGGKLPVTIQTVSEGTVLKSKNVILQITNTDPRFAWLPSYLETAILRSIWYPTTVASLSYDIKLYFKKYMEMTSDNPENIQYSLNDFGSRGVSSYESSCIGGAAHLISFQGTDNIPAVKFVRDYYDTTLENVSVSASEHSVTTSWGRDREYDALEMWLEEFDNEVLSVVIDSYNDVDFINTLGQEPFKSKIMERKLPLVVRPDCYSDDTQIMTENGWKFFKDIGNHDKVAQVLNDGSHEFVTPTKITKQYYSGEMCHFKDGKGKMDILVTPNHRMIYKHKGQEKVKYAEDCLTTFYHDYSFTRTSRVQARSSTLTPLEKLIIAYQADGHKRKGTNWVEFSFSKDRKKEYMLKLLNELGFSFTEEIKKYNNPNWKNQHRYKITVGDHINSMVKDFEWVKSRYTCSDWCNQFLNELSLWDSSIRNEGRFKFDTTDKNVSDMVELIAIRAGRGVMQTVSKDTRSDKFNTIYTSHIMLSNTLGGQAVKKETINYSGMVYCVTVPSGRVLVKRNRSTLVCGNSGNPFNVICGKTKPTVLDLTSDAETEQDFLDTAQDIMDDHLQDDTPHGEYGGDWEEEFIWNNQLYNLKYSPDWNRHDKQYYFIDNYGDKTPKILSVSPVPQEPLSEKGILNALWGIFGGTINSKGYKVLPDYIRGIQGDGISRDSLKDIVKGIADIGFSVENVLFGMGGKLLQGVDRDTLKFAMKCCEVTLKDDTKRDVFKSPVADKGKESKRGRSALIIEDGEHRTIREDELNGRVNHLITVYHNGEIVQDKMLNFDQIRANLNKDFHAQTV